MNEITRECELNEKKELILPAFIPNDTNRSEIKLAFAATLFTLCQPSASFNLHINSSGLVGLCSDEGATQLYQGINHSLISLWGITGESSMSINLLLQVISSVNLHRRALEVFIFPERLLCNSGDMINVIIARDELWQILFLPFLMCNKTNSLWIQHWMDVLLWMNVDVDKAVFIVTMRCRS